MRSIIATLAVVIVFSLEWQARLAGSGDPRLLLNRFWNSVFGASHSGTLESPSSGGSEILAEGSSAGEGPQSVAPNSALRHRKLVLPPQRPSDKATSVGKPTREAARAAPPAPLAASKESAHIADARNDSVSMPNGRTAIYDIAAHAVYLPNGDRLEAHSGLGSNLDDPRSVSVKNGGPTPPNVYELVLRKQLFHGVRAVRLVPLDQGKMFGRDGMLAHSYMHGPNGQSKGCVSFRDYPAFLSAFLRGEVERLVVVDHLADESS